MWIGATAAGEVRPVERVFISDPGYKFAGLGSFFRYALSKKKDDKNEPSNKNSEPSA